MTALWIVLVLALLIGLLLLLPIHIHLDYAQELELSVRVGFFHYQILPRKPKKEEKKEINLAEQPQKQSLSEKVNKIRDNLQRIWNLLPAIRDALKIDRLFLRIYLEDTAPADQALHYGQAWALLGGLTAFAQNLLCITHQDLDVQMSQCEQPLLIAHIRLTMRAGRGICVLWQYLRNKTTASGSKKPEKPMSKGV